VAVRHSFAMGTDVAELITIEEFIHRLDAGEKLYLYDLSLPQQLTALLLDHIRIPRYFAHCRLQRTRRRHCFDRSWPTLFIGSTGTHARLHVDQWHGHFWMCVVSGSKQWTVWHLDDAHLLSPTIKPGSIHPTFPDLEELQGCNEFTQARRVDFTLHEGEILFVPGGSPHFVVNEKDSVAFAGNFIDDSNYEAALADLRAMGVRDSAYSDVVSALEEVDWEDAADQFHSDMLKPEHLVVPYSSFRSGAAATWPSIPPNF